MLCSSNFMNNFIVIKPHRPVLLVIELRLVMTTFQEDFFNIYISKELMFCVCVCVCVCVFFSQICEFRWVGQRSTRKKERKVGKKFYIFGHTLEPTI